jgi:hypothetical protein
VYQRRAPGALWGVSSQRLTIAAPRPAIRVPRYVTSREIALMSVAVGVLGFLLVSTSDPVVLTVEDGG